MSRGYAPDVSRVRLHRVEQSTHVDGDLDVVAAHDLRRALDDALRTTTGPVTFDFSRVASADAAGIAALAWCSERAIHARRVLWWSACSQPLRRDLRLATAS